MGYDPLTILSYNSEDEQVERDAEEERINKKPKFKFLATIEEPVYLNKKANVEKVPKIKPSKQTT